MPFYVYPAGLTEWWKAELEACVDKCGRWVRVTTEGAVVEISQREGCEVCAGNWGLLAKLYSPEEKP